MSAQDKTEEVLRDFHILFSQSEIYDNERVIVNKKEVLELLQRLNVCIYDLMEEYDMTKQSRDAAEREIRRKSDEIVLDANRMAEDVYAGSVLYTDEALRRVQEIMQDAADAVKDIYKKMSDALEKEKATVHRDQSELKSHLEGLRDTDKYLNLIKDRNRQIEKERAKAKKEEEEASAYTAVKPEIKINPEYFEKAGIQLFEDEPEEEMSEELTEGIQAEVRVNLDAEYFKWKEDGGESESMEKKPEKHSIFGKMWKGEN